MITCKEFYEDNLCADEVIEMNDEWGPEVELLPNPGGQLQETGSNLFLISRNGHIYLGDANDIPWGNKDAKDNDDVEAHIADWKKAVDYDEADE